MDWMAGVQYRPFRIYFMTKCKATLMYNQPCTGGRTVSAAADAVGNCLPPQNMLSCTFMTSILAHSMMLTHSLYKPQTGTAKAKQF
jgi:hypothetical protein